MFAFEPSASNTKGRNVIQNQACAFAALDHQRPLSFHLSKQEAILTDADTLDRFSQGGLRLRRAHHSGTEPKFLERLLQLVTLDPNAAQRPEHQRADRVQAL